jgi:hypothetical protein
MSDSGTYRERLDHLRSILAEYVDFVEIYRALLDTHKVKFLVERQWHDERILSADIRENLEAFIAASYDQTIEYGSVNLLKYYADSRTRHPALSSLNSLLSKLESYERFWHDCVLTSVDKLNEQLDGGNKSELYKPEMFEALKKQSRFMRPKKAYEVDIMSEHVANWCKMLNIRTVF